MFQKIKRIVGIVLVAALFFALFYIAYIRITEKPPGFFGYRLIRVSSESMEPALDVGEVVIVSKAEPETLVKGDVICYRAEKGYLKGKLITHQISKDPYVEDGVYYFTTRSIKPEAVDDPEISEDQIIGKVTHKIPYIGTIYDFFTEWYGMVLLLVLIIIAFSDDVINIINKIREKKYLEDDSQHSNVEDIEQGEVAMEQRLNEFDGIITQLDDPDL
ncbi:MAG: signal peptidase I [Ruminococcus sp.]|nr:signal peptidase I [Ruminococcus sp.]